MRRIVRPYVAAELDQAANWYDERSPGLGRTFIEEVEKTPLTLAHALGTATPAHPEVAGPLQREPGR
jgi:hypothetical protein